MSAASKTFTGELQAVAPGAKLRLKDGTSVQVTENPGDGIWLFCKSLDADGEAERPLFLDEIVEYIE